MKSDRDTIVVHNGTWQTFRAFARSRGRLLPLLLCLRARPPFFQLQQSRSDTYFRIGINNFLWHKDALWPLQIQSGSNKQFRLTSLNLYDMSTHNGSKYLHLFRVETIYQQSISMSSCSCCGYHISRYQQSCTTSINVHSLLNIVF